MEEIREIPMSEKKVVPVAELMRDPKQQRIRFKLGFSKHEFWFLHAMITNVLLIDQVSKRERRFLGGGDLEREVLERAKQKLEQSWDRSCNAKLKLVHEALEQGTFRGGMIKSDHIRATLSYPEVMVCARAMCGIRTVDECPKTRHVLKWTEADRRLAERLWEKLLLAPRRSKAGLKAYLSHYGVSKEKIDELVKPSPDYRDAKWHRKK